MDVLRHNYVSDHNESVTLADLLEYLEEEISSPRTTQQGTPMITTAGDEVQVPRVVITMQALRQGTMLRNTRVGVCDE